MSAHLGLLGIFCSPRLLQRLVITSSPPPPPPPQRRFIWIAIFVLVWALLGWDAADSQKALWLLGSLVEWCEWITEDLMKCLEPPQGLQGGQQREQKEGKAQAPFSVVTYEVAFSGILILERTCRRWTPRSPSALRISTKQLLLQREGDPVTAISLSPGGQVTSDMWGAWANIQGQEMKETVLRVKVMINYRKLRVVSKEVPLYHPNAPHTPNGNSPWTFGWAVVARVVSGPRDSDW